MKSIKTFTFIFGISLVLFSCNKSKFKDARAYNDYIVDRVDFITGGIDKIGDAMEEMNAPQLDSLRLMLLDSALETNKVLNALEDYAGDGDFRKAAIGMVKTYTEVLQNDYAKLFKFLGNLEQLEEGDSKNEVFAEMEELVTEVDKKIELATDLAQKAQSSFGDKHNLQILPDNSNGTGM